MHATLPAFCAYGCRMLHTLFSCEPKRSDDETMACFERLGLDKYQVQDSIFRIDPAPMENIGYYRGYIGLGACLLYAWLRTSS